MTDTGLGFNLTGPDAIRKLMSDPSNLADLLMQSHGETGDSPADIFADTINMIRADTARIADAVGADAEQPERMTPGVAADLLAGTVSGDGVELVEMFNKEATRRDRVLQEVLPDDEYNEFEATKEAIKFTGGD